MSCERELLAHALFAAFVLAMRPFSEELDLALLLRVFKCLDPLPDLFSAAAVCRRWHRASRDVSLSLHVLPSPCSILPTTLTPNSFPTLAAAVAASRPGHTIRLVGSSPCAVAALILPHPLQLLGTGAVVEVVGAGPGVTVSCAARFCGLELSASLASCVLHAGGRLLLDDCSLRCADHALAHLSPPLVSDARRGGSVVVSNCRFSGGTSAVACRARARLSDVRCLLAPRAAFYWFRVDAEQLLEAEEPPPLALPVVALPIAVC